MASQKGHNILPQGVAFPNQRIAYLANKNKAFDNALLSQNNALLSKSKATRCFQ